MAGGQGMLVMEEERSLLMLICPYLLYAFLSLNIMLGEKQNTMGNKTENFLPCFLICLHPPVSRCLSRISFLVQVVKSLKILLPSECLLSGKATGQGVLAEHLPYLSQHLMALM